VPLAQFPGFHPGLRLLQYGDDLFFAESTPHDPTLSLAGHPKWRSHISNRNAPGPFIDYLAKLVLLRARSVEIWIEFIAVTRTLALPRQVGKKRRLAELVVAGQKEGVIDCLQQDV
jgi:hypothetical protein